MFSKSLQRVARTMKSSRFRYAAIFAVLVLALVFSVVSASGPRRPPQPQPPMRPPGGPGGPSGMGNMGGMGGMWGMPMPNWRPWFPMQPVPKITIIGVAEDSWAAFETENFPEDQDFTVTMGKIYTRGVNGIEVGSFNSGDGSAQQMRFKIPEELQGQERIAIRAQTDHIFPYFAFNWFWNTDSAVEVADSVDITGVTKEATVETTEAETPVETEETEATTEETTEEAAEETTTEEGVGGAGEGEEATTGAGLVDYTWQWTEFTDPVQGQVVIDNPESYTIIFTAEGLIGVVADCNNGSGTFIADDAGSIDIAIGAVTLALCEPESLSDQFLQYLNDAAVYSFDGEDLLLDLPADSGTLRFAGVGMAEEEAAAEETEAAASVTGTVTYLQRIALPDDAVVTVRIQDTSLADAPAVVVGEQVIETAGQQVPIPYEISFDPAAIVEANTYTMQARIEDGAGNLLFINDTAIPVITRDNPTEDVEIMTVPVAASDAETGEEADTEEGDSLTGTAWNWVEFSDPVQGTLTIDNPEVYTVEFFDDGTIGIQADCNNGTGAYVTEEGGGIDITVGAVTLAFCEEGSLSDQFLQYLDAAVIYFFEEGDLLMDLPIDSGTLRFAAGDAAAEAGTQVATVASTTAIRTVSAPLGGSDGAENGKAVVEKESPVPSFKICSVVQNETVSIVTSDFPADQVFAVKMGVATNPQPMQPRPMPYGRPMNNNMGGMWNNNMGGPMNNSMGRPMNNNMSGPMMGPQQMQPGGMWMKPAQQVWIPYYEAGTLETGDGGQLEATFDIPAELAGAWRISIMMRTDHMYPYISYNWFYNNTADVCNGDINGD